MGLSMNADKIAEIAYTNFVYTGYIVSLSVLNVFRSKGQARVSLTSQQETSCTSYINRKKIGFEKSSSDKSRMLKSDWLNNCSLLTFDWSVQSRPRKWVLIVTAMFSEGILGNNDIYTIQATKHHDHILNIQLS